MPESMHPREWLFDAIVADPSTSKAWLPRITGGGYANASDRGVGATRFLGLAGTRFRETILVHEQPHRWTYRVDATSIPIARPIVETWLFDELPDDTSVRWTLAIDLTTLIDPLLPARQAGTSGSSHPCDARSARGRHDR